MCNHSQRTLLVPHLKLRQGRLRCKVPLEATSRLKDSDLPTSAGVHVMNTCLSTTSFAPCQHPASKDSLPCGKSREDFPAAATESCSPSRALSSRCNEGGEEEEEEEKEEAGVKWVKKKKKKKESPHAGISGRNTFICPAFFLFFKGPRQIAAFSSHKQRSGVQWERRTHVRRNLPALCKQNTSSQVGTE